MALPFVAVLIISMIKDAYEDYKRFNQDQIGNKQLAEIYDGKEFTKVMGGY